MLRVLPGSAPPRWRKLAKSEFHKAEFRLREREAFCVAAAGHFLRFGECRGDVWRAPGGEGEAASLLLRWRSSLFPVFAGSPRVLPPCFSRRFVGRVPVHAIQGLREDAALLESLLQGQGYFAAERIDYDLMALDAASAPGACKAMPAGLVLRPPAPDDEESLFALQAAYEQEEVLSAGSVFNPAACRLNLRQLLSRQRVLVAARDGELVGKINTSAISFTRYQIGGVYVRPDCRGLGVGTAMTAVFSQSLLDQGRGLTLFVKKGNAAARAIYRKIGFADLADYRITYY
ncbi:MAG: GNAT family N-acetyltransferase [Treponema sp.]|nr:GNAT family N-acetyltransferase [Treponema sp.]